jgi:putative FmdB family regulatory protein
MPLYEYKCNKCDKTFEVLQKINDDPVAECVHCRGGVEKLISVSSFQFKGSGWYITDYKNKSAKAEKKSTTKGTKNASTNK